MENFEKYAKTQKQKTVHCPMLRVVGYIHPKSEQIGGDLLLSTEKLAEKVRISRRQNFATNVRLS